MRWMRDDQRWPRSSRRPSTTHSRASTTCFPPDALAGVRERLEDEFLTHPLMNRLVREHAPVEVPAVRTDEGVNPDIEAEAKKHG